MLHIPLKENLSCHGMQDVLEGGEIRGQETSLESLVKRRLRFGARLGEECLEGKASSHHG